MKLSILLIGLSLFLSNSASAVQTTIVETDGSACMGENMSRKQTQQAAISEAKRRAVEYLSTHITSETQVINSELQNDQISAYVNAEVSVIKELEKAWYKDHNYGDCYRVKIKAKVDPNVKPIEKHTLSDKQQAFELQENCAKYSQQFFEYFITDPSEKELYENISHYNSKLNKCFVLLKRPIWRVEDIFSKNLYDAIERKPYASFAWKVDSVKKYWEVKPLICEMLGKSCSNESEFDEFVKKYLEE